MGYYSASLPRTDRVGKGTFAWYKDDDPELQQKWHVGYGLTGSVQWVRRAFGRLPEHTMVDLQGYKMVVLNGEEVHQLNPDDRQRVFLWNLNLPENQLVTALNEEVGYVREYQVVLHNGWEFPVSLDIPRDHTLGRERVPTDALLINGYESSMRVADIFHASFFPPQIEGQQASSNKERG